MGRKRTRLRIKDIGPVLMKVIQLAEQLFPEPKSGETKRKWVVDFVNEKIDIPFLNEQQESMILGVIIDVLVGVALKK